MKSTGIVRKIDDLGRIVIPKELRMTMNLKRKDPMEIFVEGDNIIITKYEKGCLFCGETRRTFDFEGKVVCKDCLDKMEEEK